MPCGISRTVATAFVQKSRAATITSTGQKRPAFAPPALCAAGARLLLCIFLPLLAVDAIAGVRQRVESLERDLVAALVTAAKVVGIANEAPQRFIDVPEEPAFLAREQERFFALHRVGA